VVARLFGLGSIRRKLVLAMVAAVVPALLVSVWHDLASDARTSAADQAQHRLTLCLSLAAAGLGLVVVFVAGNKLAHPIRRLAHAADAMAVGDYRKRVKVVTGDELQALAESFNALGRSLARHEAAARHQSEMLAGMAEAARMASSTLHLNECGRVIAKVMCSHLGARDATVFRSLAGEGEVKPIGRCGKRARSAWRLVARRAVESHEQLMISERGLAQPGAGPGDDAILVGVPLSSGDKTIGAIVARFEGVRRNDLQPGSVRGDLLHTFGVHAAAAISNAEAYSQSEEYSEVLGEWVDHLSAVMQVADAISPSLTLDETLEALAKATAAALSADLCCIFRPDREGYLVIRACSRPDERLVEKVRFRPGETETGRAFAERRTVLCRDLRKSKSALSRRLVEQIGMRAMISTPMVVGDRAIGAITVASAKPRQFMPRDIRLLTSISLHTAVIVRNADLYTREWSIAETLQSNLVSEAPEECCGLRFACRYVPAWEEARIGGDFYDVTPLPDGKVAVVIGDVSGKGLSAAIHLAACKYMMKPLMFAYPDDPAAVLTQLNRAMNYYFNGSFFVTVFYGAIDSETGVILYANAGHLPGILISDQGKLHSWLAGTGGPLGSGENWNYQTQQVSANPGDVLLLYTDGVTDMSVGDCVLGIEGLENIVFEAGQCPGSELLSHVCNRLASDSDSVQRDDIALLAASFEGVRESHPASLGGIGGKGSVAQRQS